MEENLQPKPENNFIFSKTVRAGKRIYYFDVKKTQRQIVCILLLPKVKKKIPSTTSKKKQVAFTKQRLLLYKEDFGNFVEALNECVDFIDMSDNEQDVIAKQLSGKSDFDDIDFDI